MSHSRSNGGIAALEFALVAPVLAMLLVLTADAVIWLRTWMRVDETAAQVANIAGQYQSLAQSDILDLFAAAQQIAGNDIDVTQSGGCTAILLLTGTSQGNSLTWQRYSPSGSSTPPAVCQKKPITTVLPGGYLIPDGETLLLVEVGNTASQWVFGAGFMGSSGQDSIWSYATQRPRLSSLSGAPT